MVFVENMVLFCPICKIKMIQENAEVMSDVSTVIWCPDCERPILTMKDVSKLSLKVVAKKGD